MNSHSSYTSYADYYGSVSPIAKVDNIYNSGKIKCCQQYCKQSFLEVKTLVLDIYLKIFIGYGKSIDKLGFDILDNLANLPPLSVLGFLLMAISMGGIALQLSTFIADGKDLGTHLEVLVY